MRIYIPVSLLILASIFFPPASGDRFEICSLNASNAAPTSSSQPSIRPAQLMNALEGRIGDSSQILLVWNINPTAVDVRISPWERKNGSWQSPFAPLDGVIGRKGFAPPGEKREGDGRTPAGIFPLGTVFGYEPSIPTRMPYRQATGDDLWIDDVQADDYNRWVKRGATQATSFERMRRNDDLYKYGIVVEYNTNPVVKGYGSAIFFHLWRGKDIPTAGCIALSAEDLIRIMKWLDPVAKPLVVMGQQATIGGF
jgi:L,D-peptidoglycan transpeptidase YkuD (ErfK/YbiS/YcfS/YnhG family)